MSLQTKIEAAQKRVLAASDNQEVELSSTVKTALREVLPLMSVQRVTDGGLGEGVFEITFTPNNSASSRNDLNQTFLASLLKVIANLKRKQLDCLLLAESEDTFMLAISGEGDLDGQPPA